MKTYRLALIDKEMVPTAIRVALIVGTILFGINHSHALLQGKMNRTRWFSALLSYAVPYCVNIHGQVSGRAKYAPKPVQSRTI